MRSRPLTLTALAAATACGNSSTQEPDAAIDAAPAALYEPEARYTPGDMTGAITYTTDDPTTPDRTIQLRVRFPMNAPGPRPAVVVIHGGGFNANGHTALADWGAALATAGYVAIHFGNAFDEIAAHCTPLAIPAGECMPTSFTDEVSAGGTLPIFMFTRPNDASAIADRLDAIATTIGVAIDPDKLAVLGHSAGAHATMALAGTVIDVSPSVHAMPVQDTRFKAFVANSPQGIGRMGLTATSWDTVTSPVLIQTGRNDATAGEPAAGRRDAFVHLPGPGAYEHFIDDDATAHDVFALEHDPGVAGNELALATTAIAFLDATLLGRPEATAYLASDELTAATGGTSILSRK